MQGALGCALFRHIAQYFGRRAAPAPETLVTDLPDVGVHTSGAQRARLLVVDDDPLSTAYQSHLASLLGHHATVETHPEAALQLAVDGEFDLMLLDLSMPELDGFAVLRLLREHETRTQRAALPVIAVTGYASDADRARCLEAGFADHLSKPIQARVLTDAIERVLGQGVASVKPDTDAGRLRETVRRLNEDKNGDERGFAPTVTEKFALRAAQFIDEMRRGAQHGEAELIKRSARGLKASAEFLGATRLSQMCSELGARAGQDDWSKVAEAITAIDHEHQAVLTLLFESAR